MKTFAEESENWNHVQISLIVQLSHRVKEIFQWSPPIHASCARRESKGIMIMTLVKARAFPEKNQPLMMWCLRGPHPEMYSVVQKAALNKELKLVELQQK